MQGEGEADLAQEVGEDLDEDFCMALPPEFVLGRNQRHLGQVHAKDTHQRGAHRAPLCNSDIRCDQTERIHQAGLLL